MQREQIEHIACDPQATQAQLQEAIDACETIISEAREYASCLRRNGYREEDVEQYVPHSVWNLLTKLQNRL